VARDKSGNEREPDLDTIYPNIHNMAIFECAVNVLRVLLDEVGPNRTLAAIKPYSNYNGKFTVGLAQQRFGPQGSEVESVAMPFYWLHCGTSNGHCKPLEIRDGKAIVELNACPSKFFKAPPEICVALSHYVAEGIAEAANPAYEYVFTHHLANNDDCCRYVVKKKTDKFSLDNPGKLEKSIPLELTQGEMDAITETVAFGSLFPFTNASIELVGSDRTLEMAIPLQRETGQRLGAKYRSEAGGECELPMLRDGLDFLCSPLDQVTSSAIINESRIEKVISTCPFTKYLPPPWPCVPSSEFCAQMEAVSKGVCEAMNPDYEFFFDQMMSKGDPTCHWVVRKKSEKGEAKPQESMQDDSMGY
jgi:hypothetical protein